MATRRPPRQRATADPQPVSGGGHRGGVDHLAILVGTAQAWAGWSADSWSERVAEWAKVADHGGVRWLSVRPVGAGEAGDTVAVAGPAGAAHHTRVGGCSVVVDPADDGRARLVAALAACPPSAGDAEVSARLNHPAPTDPDLIIVVGPDDRLPASVVWELAYAELVFIPVGDQELTADHVEAALGEYRRRHRRFGGLD